MTDAAAKRISLRSVRTGFLREEVPTLGQVIEMLAAGVDMSPTWQDIVDVDTIFLHNDVLHVSASITIPPTMP